MIIALLKGGGATFAAILTCFSDLSTRWTTNLSSQVNLSPEISCGVLCGANLVTLRSKFRTNETLEVHRLPHVDARDWPLPVARQD